MPLSAITALPPKKDIMRISSSDLRPRTDPAPINLSPSLGNGY